MVTTGTFTIPLMKRVGFPAEKAGAVEVASSTNGQLTPPIMGAAAFLMVEYVGISYLDVITNAALPALISYIALVYIVHLEASKADLKGLPRPYVRPFKTALLSFLMTFLGLVVLSAAVYYGIGWIKDLTPDFAVWIVGAGVFAAYVGLVWNSCRFPALSHEPAIDHCPEVKPTVNAGLQYLLPVVVLVWCLTVERLSPGLSAFWAAAFMMVIVVTQPPLEAIFRHADHAWGGHVKRGLTDLFDGMVAGARNMIGIGVATAAAGIVVGTVTLTGIGQVMTEFVEFISGGSLILILLFTAVISLVLGMGLPTTANYIVVSSLMAPVIVNLGAENGLIIPLIAAHMFVFYFGILADDTPPVGLAAFAAAAIAKSDPIKTGIQGFTYDIRTAILPFLFVFNTQLLLIGIDHWFEGVITFVSAVIAMMCFAAATQHYMIVRNRLWETAALLLIAFTMFRPGYWMDMIEEPFEDVAPAKIEEVVAAKPSGARLHLSIEGYTFEGDPVSKVVMLPLGPKAPPEERLYHAGLELHAKGDKVFIKDRVFGSQAEKLGLEIGYEITSVQRDSDRPPKQLFFIPALALLAAVYFAQRNRKRRAEAATA